MSQLGLIATSVQWTSDIGRWRKKLSTVQRSFIDWSVDGVGLRELVAQREGSGGTLSTQHSALVDEWPWPEVAARNLGELLGDAASALDSGRVPLLFCPLCADPGCATLTADVVVVDDVVEWRDLGWETDWQPFDLADDGFDPPLTFRFASRAYRAILQERLAYYSGLAAAQEDDRR